MAKKGKVVKQPSTNKPVTSNYPELTGFQWSTGNKGKGINGGRKGKGDQS